MYSATLFSLRHVGLGLAALALTACGSADGGDGAASSTEAAISAGDKCYVEALEGLYVRSSPNLGQNVTMKLACGTKVTVRSVQNGWAEVGENMGEGAADDFVSARWLDCTGRVPVCPGGGNASAGGTGAPASPPPATPTSITRTFTRAAAQTLSVTWAKQKGVTASLTGTFAAYDQYGLLWSGNCNPIDVEDSNTGGTAWCALGPVTGNPIRRPTYAVYTYTGSNILAVY